MYVPPHFAQHDPIALRALVRKHGFASFVSATVEGESIASHLPCCLSSMLSFAGLYGT